MSNGNRQTLLQAKRDGLLVKYKATRQKWENRKGVYEIVHIAQTGVLLQNRENKNEFFVSFDGHDFEVMDKEITLEDFCWVILNQNHPSDAVMVGMLTDMAERCREQLEG